MTPSEDTSRPEPRSSTGGHAHMRCPGCRTKIRFPKQRRGQSYIHSCGTRLVLDSRSVLVGQRGALIPRGGQRSAWKVALGLGLAGTLLLFVALRRASYEASQNSEALTVQATPQPVAVEPRAPRTPTPDADSPEAAVLPEPQQPEPKPEPEPEPEAPAPVATPEAAPTATDEGSASLIRPEAPPAVEQLPVEKEPSTPVPAEIPPQLEPAPDVELPFDEGLRTAAARWSECPREERSALVAQILALIETGLSESHGQLAARRLQLLDTRELRGLFKNKELAAARDLHRQTWVDQRLLQACGPYELLQLRELCKDWKLKTRRKQTETLLSRLQPSSRFAGAQKARSKVRERRASAEAVVATFQHERRSELLDALAGFLDQQPVCGTARDRLSALFDALQLEPGHPLRQRLAEAAAVSATALTLSDEKFDAQLSKVLKPTITELFDGIEKLLEADLGGLAFDLYQTLISLDPDNERAHRGLGHERIDGVWYRAYEASMLHAGFAWHDRYAWVPVGHEERLAAGEIFDRGWTSLVAADQKHSQVDDPWRLQSEHFTLISTAPLEQTAAVLQRLEAVFLQVFRNFDLFFRGEQGQRLIFGAAQLDARLVVHLFASREQFLEHADVPVDWAAGFYSPTRAASFFYCDGPTVSFSVLQHELVHQILGELSPGHAPSWLAEGAAVLLEDAFFAGALLSTGGLVDNGRVLRYARNLQAGGNEHSFRAILRYASGAQWDSGDISANYRAAGASVYFMMHVDGGRFRGDFLDMLYDAYHGAARPPEYYFGLSLECLDTMMERYFQTAVR